MDSLIVGAARALAAGDMLGALKRVALREDPPALALRGIAMAQLGEHLRARDLLRRAARGFGSHEPLAQARCIVAEAEVALALRDLGGSTRALDTAAATLEARGDLANAVQARLIAARRLLLLGQLDAAATAVTGIDPARLAPPLAAVAALTSAELALRSLHTGEARAALRRAQAAAAQAGVPSLVAEVAEAMAVLTRPAARVGHAGGERTLQLAEVEALLASDTLVVDACRRGLRTGSDWRPLARRPVLFALATALASSWPADADRNALIAAAFHTRDPDETHRARLRVEIGRLRALLSGMATIEATPRGFALRPAAGRPVAVLQPPLDGEPGALLALLSDGAAWSTAALAMALDASQRTVQRALADLESAGRVRAIGQTRTRRWLAPPLAAFTTILLLPASLPSE